MSKNPIEIPDLGLFEPYFLESGELFYYFRKIEFKNSFPKLVVYPDDVGPSKMKNRQELKERFLRFTEKIDIAMSAFPGLLRKECREYRISESQISDKQLVADLDWTNINLDPGGTIECYATNLAVSNNFDISFGFTNQIVLYRLQFDG